MAYIPASCRAVVISREKLTFLFRKKFYVGGAIGSVFVTESVPLASVVSVVSVVMSVVAASAIAVSGRFVPFVCPSVAAVVAAHAAIVPSVIGVSVRHAPFFRYYIDVVTAVGVYLHGIEASVGCFYSHVVIVVYVPE